MSENKAYEEYKNEYFTGKESLLEVPKVGDTNSSTLASVDLCHKVTHGSGKVMAHAQVIPTSILLKSGRTIGGA